MVKRNKRKIGTFGRSTEQTRMLRDIYGELKVIDAKDNLRIFVNEEDIRGARRNSLCDCVFARASRRQYGSTAVVFFKTIAYVDLPDENGVHVINRFIIPEAMKSRVIHFDKTGEANPGGFSLLAPAVSSSLEYKLEKRKVHNGKPENKMKARKRNKKYVARRRAVLLGHLKPAKYDINKTVDGPIGYVRDGTGMAQFSTRKKKAA